MFILLFLPEICQGLNEANKVSKKIRAWKIGERIETFKNLFSFFSPKNNGKHFRYFFWQDLENYLRHWKFTYNALPTFLIRIFFRFFPWLIPMSFFHYRNSFARISGTLLDTMFLGHFLFWCWIVIWFIFWFENRQKMIVFLGAVTKCQKTICQKIKCQKTKCQKT